MSSRTHAMFCISFIIVIQLIRLKFRLVDGNTISLKFHSVGQKFRSLERTASPHILPGFHAGPLYWRNSMELGEFCGAKKS